MVSDVVPLWYVHGFEELELMSLELRRLKADLIGINRIIRCFENIDQGSLFQMK